MICTTQQLIEMRNQWLQMARTDLRNQVINFMEANRINEAELANVLALNVESVRAMLNASRDITLQEFATLLIATDNVLEIKPVSQTPLANRQGVRPTPNRGSKTPQRDANGRFVKRGDRHMPPMGGMPMGGGYPMPPMDGNGHPMPPMGGMPMPPMGDMFGGMPGISTPKPSEPTDARTSIEFDGMTRPDLIDEICNNGWESEIDLARATRSQLISFLESKKTVATEEVETEGDDDSSIDAIARGLADVAKNNPAMLNALKSILGK